VDYRHGVLQAAASVSGNHRLTDNDVRHRITKNRHLRECSHDREDLPGSSSFKSPTPKPPMIGSPQPPSAKKGAYGASTSNQQPTDQPAEGKKKEADDKEVIVNPSNPNKKLRVSICLRPNRNSHSSFFSRKIWMSSHTRYQICMESTGR
jgi:hypothetical protein